MQLFIKILFYKQYTLYQVKTVSWKYTVHCTMYEYPRSLTIRREKFGKQRNITKILIRNPNIVTETVMLLIPVLFVRWNEIKRRRPFCSFFKLATTPLPRPLPFLLVFILVPGLQLTTVNMFLMLRQFTPWPMAYIWCSKISAAILTGKGSRSLIRERTISLRFLRVLRLEVSVLIS